MELSANNLNVDPNLLLAAHNEAKVVDVNRVNSPVILQRPRQIKRRLRDARSIATAMEALSGLAHDNEIYGFTKGQFSLLHTIEACLEITGPAVMSLSTWTAARHEIVRLKEVKDSGKLLSMRFLTDVSFARRDPEAAHMLRQAFGLDNMRISQCHAKFFTLRNESWRLVMRTSMNLNMNPRFEDFSIANDPELFDFVNAILDEIWSKQKKELQIDGSRSELGKQFRAL